MDTNNLDLIVQVTRERQAALLREATSARAAPRPTRGDPSPVLPGPSLLLSALWLAAAALR